MDIGHLSLPSLACPRPHTFSPAYLHLIKTLLVVLRRDIATHFSFSPTLVLIFRNFQ